MSDVLETLRRETENVWNEARQAFEKEALRENESLAPYHDLFAWADGTLLALPQAVGPDEKGLHTVARMLIRDRNLVSPCEGTVQSVDPQSNTIIVKTPSGRDLGIKVCTGAVSFARSAHVLVQPGQAVRVGQALVQFENPVEARSKLFLIHPETDSRAVAEMQPEARTGDVSQGDRLLRGKL